MIIEDGSGGGFAAAVDAENRLEVDAATAAKGLWINQENEDLYSASLSVTPSAGGVFCYIKNLDERDMIFVRISIRCPSGSTEGVEVKLNDVGTPVGGSTLTVTNRNAGSGKIADITGLFGQNITGLSGGGSLGEWYLHNTGGSHVLRWWNGVIVPKNRTITFYASTGLIPLNFVTIFYFASD